MEGKLFSCKNGMNSIGSTKERLSVMKPSIYCAVLKVRLEFLLLQAAWSFQGEVKQCCT